MVSASRPGCCDGRHHTRPVVAIIPTGDEIRPIGADLARGEVLDTNSLLLAATLAESGCEVRTLPIQPDLPERITATARSAAHVADLVLILAGSSVGRDDHTADVVRALGEVVVHGVAIRPGHPVVLGVLHGDSVTPVIGVPGYSVSAALTVDLFALPLLYQLQGRQPPRRPTVTARIAADIPPAAMDRYILLTLPEPNPPAGSLPVAEPSPQGDGPLSALSRANGRLHVPAGEERRAGETVTMRVLRREDSRSC